jgi:hypothetical protein
MLGDIFHVYFQDLDITKIFHDVIGTSKAQDITLMLQDALDKHIYSEIEEILFIESSIGVVFGLGLNNGQKIVLKAYSKKIALTYLERMNCIQTIFYQAAFPAPKPLSPIFQFGKTHAGFYALIEGGKEDAHEENIMLELALYLASFSRIVDENQLEPMENFFQQAPKRNLWPKPHNILFDLKNTTRGAGFIAEHARRAKRILAASKFPKRLAHTDWGVKNVHFKDKKLVGIFDWDSLGAMSECQMVGQAAAQFTADWETPFKITPSPAEGRAFFKAYENFRKLKFNEEEYKVISASSDYIIAIIARFEHAGGGKEHPYQDLLKGCQGKSFLLA